MTQKTLLVTKSIYFLLLGGVLFCSKLQFFTTFLLHRMLTNVKVKRRQSILSLRA